MSGEDDGPMIDVNDEDNYTEHNELDVHRPPPSLKRVIKMTTRVVERALTAYMPGLSHAISMYQLEPGDHIYAYRAAGIYSHHGIYVGNFEVIHFNGEPGTSLMNMDARISNDPLDIFLNGASLRKCIYGVSDDEHLFKRKGTCCQLESDPSDSVIARALHCLDNQGMPRYNILKFNCEHFALYCKLGERILDLGSSWLGQFQEIFHIPMYPFKAIGAMVSMYRRHEGEEERQPTDSRFLGVVDDDESGADNRATTKRESDSPLIYLDDDDECVDKRQKL